MKAVTYFAIVTAMLLGLPSTQAADSLTQNLQHGLFEEEANHNLEAAIKAYQSVIAQSDEQRKVIATALFRLGECHRKLGKTNEATAFYQRILRDFADQEQLVALSRQNVRSAGGSFASTTPAGSAATAEEALQLANIKAMVKDSPDLINSRDPNGNTPLHTAAQSGYYSVAEFLIANRADVNAENNSNRTPLQKAADSGHKRLIELLLAHGAEVNQGGDGGPLFLAAANGYTGVVEVLLNNKAEVNRFGPNGDQPLHVAARKGYTQVVGLLLAHGAEIDRLQSYHPRGSLGTPLHLAAGNRRAEVVELLLSHKANVNSKDSAGATPLRWAAVDSSPAIVKMLLDAGADPNIRDNAGQSALFSVGNPQVVELLLKRKADPNTTNAAGQSALAALVENVPNTNSIELLLKHGADPNRPDEHGTPILFSAVFRQQAPVVEVLLEHGANPNVLVNGDTPLSHARRAAKDLPDDAVNARGRANWRQIEKVLVDHGANENLVRLSKITYVRPSWRTDQTWLTRGTNDVNRYTLFELLSALEPSVIAFADFSRMTILRLNPTNSTTKEIEINLENSIQSGDCATDTWLEWGDRVMIPERDHGLNESWSPPPELRTLLENCLSRRVRLIVKGMTNNVRLLPHVFPAGHSFKSPTLTDSERTVFSFRLASVVYAANVLRASSDVTKVRVKRTDSRSKASQEWTLDLTRVTAWNEVRQPSKIPLEHDLWLRDGDVIEVPEKRGPVGDDATANSGLSGFGSRLPARPAAPGPSPR
jgi:ankyrin repeat protein